MSGQLFGGSWTEKKLGALRQYLEAYLTALKKQNFELIYIDAFAGTGHREIKSAGSQPDLLELQKLMAGSARIALEMKPPFHRYVFIEKARSKISALQKLAADFPQLRDRIKIIRGDANREIARLCQSTNWRGGRAVMFLDPYGMQVDWATIEAISKTKAVDLWYLFPAGIGVSRSLTKDAKIPAAWQTRLDRMFGETKWREAFYSVATTPDLFGATEPKLQRDADVAQIESYFRKRLESVFAGVAKHALPLTNKKNVCMFLLFFACANPKGVPIALKIADHILKS